MMVLNKLSTGAVRAAYLLTAWVHGDVTMTMRPAWRGGVRMEARPHERIHTVP